MEVTVEKNVVFVFFVHLIMKSMFKEYKRLHYLPLMIKGFLKVTLKVNLEYKL